MTRTVRLLLADENDDILDGLCAWLRERPDFKVIDVAHSGREVIERIQWEDPDLVLMDMALPDMSGLEVTRRIKSLPRSPLVVLTAFHDSQAIRAEAKTAGADGFLSKPHFTAEFFPVVERLLRSRPLGPMGALPGERNTGAEKAPREIKD